LNRRLKTRPILAILVILGLFLTLAFLGLSAQSPKALAQTPESRVITVSAVGDIMLGTENLLPPDGGVGFLKDPEPYLVGRDLVFGNLEGPLTDQGAPTKDTSTGRSFCFRTPPAYARFLKKAGFNILSLANNHANDYGPLGRAQTVEVLKELDIKTVGDPGQLTEVDLGGGLKAVFLALAPNRGCQNINDLEGAVALVKKALADDPKALVIVSFHGGAEGTAAMDMPLGPETFMGENRGDLRRLATTLIDNGASLIIGHGPHVPRGLEVYKDRLIIYSLGNFATAAGINVKGATGLAPLIQVDLAPDGRLLSHKIISFRQAQNQGPKLDATEEARKVMEKLSLELTAKINKAAKR
jgi:poly-gamma-glutamate capsule biosynthesis protein CapA/YwtB (metallophosphatase superfamily)